MKLNKGFAHIVSLLLIAAMIASGLFVRSEIEQLKHKTEEAQVLGAFNPTGGGTYRLSSSISSTASSITLSSFKEPVSETPYTMTYLNTDIMYGTIEPLNPDKSEFISFTGITQNSNGTATLTGVSRGLARSYPYTASTTHAQTHTGQSIFILSDSPQLFNTYLNAADTETITGDWTFASTSAPVYSEEWNIASTSKYFVYANWVNQNYLDHASTSARNLKGFYTFTSTGASSPIFTGLLSTASSTFAAGVNTIWPTASSSATSKGYVDAQVVSGCSDADTSTRGCVEEATLAELEAGSATGGTGAKLFMTPATFFSSNIKRANFYGIASSTTTADFSTTTTMTAGETLMIWANGNVTCSGVKATWSLFIKPPLNATTTIDTQVCGDGSGRSSSVTTMAMWTATSTGDYKIFTTQNTDEQTNIMFIKFKN